jgi:hypothetical protein
MRPGGAEERHATVTVYLQHRKAWARLPGWPPTAEVIRMSAGADSVLVRHAPAAVGALERRVDPTVGIRGGLWGLPARGFGLPRDQHEDDARSLAFTSAPLDAPLQLCGRAAATVTLARDPGPARTLVVKLAHVGADGRSTLITSATAALPALTEGDATEASARLEMIPTAYEIPAGDRVRLIVAGADFPRLWPDPTVERLMVRCGADGTFIELPVVRFDELEEPALPAPDHDGSPPSLVLRADPLYTVTHDALTDGVTVTVGDHLLMKTPQEERLLDINGHVSAVVSAERPEAARVTGRSVARASTAHGEFVARAEILLTRESAVITGEVTLEGRPVFSRRWTA